MLRLLSAVILAFLTAALLLRGAKPRPQLLKSLDMSASCGTAAQKYKAVLSSSLVLNHAVLGHAPRRADIEDAVTEQLAYLRGLFFNHYNEHSGKTVFAKTWSDFRVVAETLTPYGVEAVIDTPKPYPEVPPKEYVELARKRGAVHAADQATVVDYEVQIEAIGCGYSEGVLQYKPDLPRDPYLAYWNVPAAGREWKTWHSSAAQINPCADSELADLPSPEYYWYFYNPHAAGCAGVLLPGTSHTASLDMSSAENLDTRIAFEKTALEKVDELRMSMIFGYIVHAEQYASPADVARALKDDVSPVDPILRSWDASSRQFLWMWSHLADVADIVEVSFEPGEKHLLATAKGKYKVGGKKFILRAYLGPTDLYGPIEPEHWVETLRGMLNDDVFIYAGHSGLGENLRTGRLTALEMPTGSLSRRPDYQIFSFLSCYAYTYFDQGEFPSIPFASAREKVDLILSAGSTSELGMASLATFKTIGLALASKDGRVEIGEAFPAGLFIVHRTLKPNASSPVSMR